MTFPAEILRELRNRFGPDKATIARLIELAEGGLGPARGETITLYVNNVTGRDTNTGLTQDTPFKTLNHALKQVPLLLTRDYYIHLAYTGIDYEGSELERFWIPLLGAIVIYSEDINVLDTGTVTANGSINLTDSGKSWTPDAYVGNSIRLTSTPTTPANGREKRIMTICRNSATVVDLSDRLNPRTDDTYEIFEPQVVINLPREIGGGVTRRTLTGANNDSFDLDTAKKALVFANVKLFAQAVSSVTAFEGDVEFLGCEIDGNSLIYFGGQVSCGHTSRDILNLEIDYETGARGWGLHIKTLLGFIPVASVESVLDGLVTPGVNVGFGKVANVTIASGRIYGETKVSGGSSLTLGEGGTGNNGNLIIQVLDGSGDSIDIGVDVRQGAYLRYDLTCEMDINSTAGSVGILARGTAVADGSAPIDANQYAVQVSPGGSYHVKGNAASHTANGSNTAAYAAGTGTPTPATTGGAGDFTTDGNVVVNAGELTLLHRDDQSLT